MPTLVLIHIGDAFPEYINECIKQVQSVSDIDLHILINNKHKHLLVGGANVFTLENIPKCDQHLLFEQKSTLDSSFRGGFWRYATERFFYLYEHMLALNLVDVFHIESDNLIYYDFISRLKLFQTKSMWCVLDALDRCIPSFMYLKNNGILLQFLETYVNKYLGLNDMKALAEFRNSNSQEVGVLPIISNYVDSIDPIFYDRAKDFGMVFDAAAIGQYIGGVDPRNISGDTTGFINETAVVKCNKINLTWINGRLVVNGLPLVNLHVHSKDLKRWSNYDSAKIISGEKIQELCDLYIGRDDDFKYNPRILKQVDRCISLDSIRSSWNNPTMVFCYGHRIGELCQKIDYLENDFILVTHNSDENITDKYKNLLENPKLLFWHAQNVIAKHPKLGGLPIGFANSMWNHGDINSIKSALSMAFDKVNDFYFYFKVHTNPNDRNLCKSILEGKGLVFDGESVDFSSYLSKLGKYKFAICPPGNGIDSHRIWECLYLNVIPILIRSDFTERINKRFACVLLDSWNDFDADKILADYKIPTYSDDLAFKNIKLGLDAYF